MDQLYFNGDIITMENEEDAPEAVLVSDGIIKAVGSLEDLFALKADGCQARDLQGKTLMPAFIDGHSHIYGTGLSYLLKANLESAENFQDLIDIMKAFIEKNHIPAGHGVVGVGYDHNFMEEHLHPDKKILDQISTEHPVVVSHISGHMGACNSLALETAGIDANTVPNDGEVIGRYEDTNEPTGYLEESAILRMVRMCMPKKFDPEKLLNEIQYEYIKNGITTAQDGGTSAIGLRTMRGLDDKGLLKLDIRTYPSPLDSMTPEGLDVVLSENKDLLGEGKNHLKICGYKILLDGSPQGKSAWMSKPYENSGDYCGYPWMSDDDLRKYVKLALDDNMQLLAHCNGDAASQQYLDIYEEMLEKSDNPNKYNLRPVMIHCQTVRDDQLDRMVKIKMLPSFFVSHTWYWGDVHLKNFGDARGRRVSPVKSAVDRGLKFNLHTDTPVVRPDILHTIWTAVNRVTREGRSIGPEQCVSVYEALQGQTINAAYSYFEEDSKGSLKAGKRADMIILDRNPLKVDKMEIKNLKVLETIKDGQTIFQM